MSEHPLRALNIVAGRWSVRRAGTTAVYFHPAHDRNVDDMLSALVAARQRYAEWFHPYPWTELKLSEFPNLIGRAQGFATNINFSEGFGFLTRSNARSHQAFIVTAHEAAHQWWGNLLLAGAGPGADVLVEGAAHYSTLLLLEAERGPHARIEFARRLEERFLDRRRTDGEASLLRVVNRGNDSDESAIYDKGGWVLWMLHQHLGHERAIAGMRAFFSRYVNADGAPELPDLISTLRPFAPDPLAFDAFIATWFADTALPEFIVDNVRRTPSADGWTLSARVRNVGAAAATIDVSAVDGEAGDARVTVHLAPGESRPLTWSTGLSPTRVIVDPDVMVLQLNRARAHAEL